MIGSLLPDQVAVAEAFSDPPDARLYPEEEAVVARAVAKRRAEFTTARACARRALSALGLPPVPVLPGPHREPCWPDGVVGSITHCRGYRAAAVARASDIASVGIDAEPHEPLPEGVLEAIALDEERAGIRALGTARADVCWDRLLFSAKESVYKVWFPLAARWLGFEDALVTVDPNEQAFSVKLLVPGPPYGSRELTAMAGRWSVADGLVLTAIALDPAGDPSGLRAPAA